MELSAIYQVQVILWLAAFCETTIVQEIESLKVAASELGLPSETWNFSTDPCLNGWTGVVCCVEKFTTNLDTDCCASYYPHNPRAVSCSNSPKARVSALILRSGNFTLNGILSESLCNLTLLMNLDLSGHRQLRGEIPECIGSRLSNLRYISIGDNLLNGSFPKHLGALSNLEVLELYNNNLKGEIPLEIGQLSSLTTLYLDNNKLEGELPEEIGQLRNLKFLYLQVNKLRGGIPSSFSELASLKELKLYNNELSGELPPSLFRDMSNLDTLNLRKNNFTGRVPDFSNPSLATIDLGFNFFLGNIPDLGESESIKYLFLGHNRLSGSIPTSFGSDLPSLARLDLSHNMLVGSLAAINKEIPQLDISFNFFDVTTGPYSITKQWQPLNSFNAFFNCNNSNAGSCLRSSPGREMFFAVNSGGNNITNLMKNGIQMRFDGEKEIFKNLNSSVGFFYGILGPWALELSGDAGGTYSSSFQAPVNLSGAGRWASQELYSSMRWSSTYIAYHGYDLRSGLYTVTLHFAELVFLEPGYRMFDVILQGQVLEKNLDIVSKAGPRAAYQITRKINVTNGSVSVELVHSGPKRYLDDTWPGQSSGPIISGISVVHASFKGGRAGSSSHRLSSSQTAEIAVASGIVGSILLAVGLCFCFRRERGKLLFVYCDGVASNPGFVDVSLGAGGAMSYQELFNATRGFSEKIGEGGFGAVYKGTLPSGTLVAVKQLVKKNAQLSKHNSQIQEDFHREISIISKVRHRNLLAVIGHSLDSDTPMLVCEFIPNGSLDRWLWKKNQVLSWEVRRKIAIGVSCGLAYLHDESACKIIHCDVKPANILLDSDFNPRIADFGLAKLYDEKRTHVTETRLKGTAGYLAPEYAMQLQLSEKVDVYSFGAVLLELLSGRRVVEVTAPTEQIILVDWARTEARVNPENMLDMMDKRLQGKYVKQEARDMMTIAVLCTQSSASLRPKMQNVWLMLNGTVKVPDFLEDLEADNHLFGTSIEATISSSS